MGLRTCTKCACEKPLAEFAKKARGRGGRGPWCRACAARDNARRYRGARQRLNEIKLAAGCRDCGFREHPAALHFDHLPGSTKEFNVGAFGGVTWSRVLAEIAKCEVVCANCHAVRTAERRA